MNLGINGNGFSLEQFEKVFKNEEKKDDKSLSKSIFNNLMDGKANKTQSAFLSAITEGTATDNKMAFLSTSDKNSDESISKKELKDGIRKYKSANRKEAKAEKKLAKAENTDDPIVKERLLNAAARKKEAAGNKFLNTLNQNVEAQKTPDKMDSKEIDLPTIDAPGLTIEKSETEKAPSKFAAEYTDQKAGTLEEDGSYAVKKGDSLYTIVKEQILKATPDASKSEILDAMNNVYNNNKDQGLMGNDKNKINAGQKLDLSSITNVPSKYAVNQEPVQKDYETAMQDILPGNTIFKNQPKTKEDNDFKFYEHSGVEAKEENEAPKVTADELQGPQKAQYNYLTGLGMDAEKALTSITK